MCVPKPRGLANFLRRAERLLLGELDQPSALEQLEVAPQQLEVDGAVGVLEIARAEQDAAYGLGVSRGAPVIVRGLG